MQLQTLRNNLKRFFSVEWPVEVPPAALFSVDLSDEAAVERRVKELRLAVLPDGEPPASDAAPKTPREEFRALEQEVIALRLRFLSLPPEQRAGMLSAEDSVRAYTENAERLARERSSAEQERETAVRSVEAAEEMARTAGSGALKKLAARRAILENTRGDLANLQVRWTGALEERNRIYRETAHDLSALAARETRGDGAEAIRNSYVRSNEIWRKLVDRIFSQLASPEIVEPVPDVPPLDKSLLRTLPEEQNPETEAYRSVHGKVADLHRSLLHLREGRYRSERDQLYLLLLQSSELRSRMLQAYVRAGGSIWTGSPRETAMDLLREIRIVPYRFIALSYAKLVEFRGKTGAGIHQLTDIVRQIFLLLALLAVPYATYKLLYHLRWKIDRASARIASMQDRLPSARSLALFLKRVNPYFPWIVMLLGVFLAEALMGNTALAEAGQLLPYLSFYIGYRIFRILGTSFFGVVASAGESRVPAADLKRIRDSVRRIGQFFLVAISVLYATKMVVGKALVYEIVSGLTFSVGTLALLVAARQWRREIGEKTLRVLPEWAGARISRLCAGKFTSWVSCFPALVIVAVRLSVNRLLDWASRFDLFKRAGAELFRRRLEGSADKTGGSKTQVEIGSRALPQEYLRWFALHSPPPENAVIEPEEGIATELRSLVEEWANGRIEEHSVILHGDKGSGKTTLLSSLAAGLPVERVVHAPLPSRLLSREQVLSFFGERLGTDLVKDPKALVGAFTGTRKTLVLIDDAQNLFLSALGGFEAYRTLGDLINTQTDSLFWVAAINRRSWGYLEGVFGKNQWFRRVFEAPPWSDNDIRRMILSRHELSGLRLSYDAIIRVMHGGIEDTMLAQLETQFFRLLWGQSRGNPRAAIVLWLSAISVAPDGGLRVGIPRFQSFQALEDAGDDTLFVFSAIIRHENLTMEEIVRVADLPERVVRHAIRLGVDNGVVARFPDGRYRATPEAQFALNQLLERRNFLYG